jgi:sigma-B regulation protein RsbU (phosphoserine phosphatase)
MTTRRLIVLFAFALIGYCGLFLLFPRTNVAARWNFGLDRGAAIEKAKEAARFYGYNAIYENASVVVEYNRTVEDYLHRQSNPLLGSLLSPLTARVMLNDASSGRGFEARLNSRGELTGFRHRERSSRQSRPNESPSSSPAAENSAEQKVDASSDRRIAEEALQKVVADHFGKFAYLSDSNTGKEGIKFTWTASDDLIKVLADVTVRDGQVRELWLQPNLAPRFQAEVNSQRSDAIAAMSAAEHLLIWPAIVLVIILYFIGLAQRRIDHRKTLTFLLLCFLLLLTINLLGDFADGFRANFRISNAPLSPFMESAILWTVFALVNLSIVFSLYMLLAAGLSLSTGLHNRRTIDLELLLKGKLLKRPVTGSILAGLTLGGLLALIPHAIVATGALSGATINASGLDDIFAARIPAFDAPVGGSQYMIFLTFAFLVPCLDAYVKRMWVASVSVFTIVFLNLIGLEAFYTSALALAITGLLQAFLLVWVYRNFGLVAVIVTSMAAQSAISSAALMAQSSTSLQSSGWKLLAGLGWAMALALIGLWRSSEVKEEEIKVEWQSESRAERDRLQAEFAVARKAQQHMLPDRAPDVPGLSISAICQPSKEVGGDLYDFLALPEGRIGIVVADVSGKGVPASLYMTLTKGLLDSITEYQTDPGEILREVNRHLYDVCRRRLFVTMVLGVIDPASKMLYYARAGHNPTIVYRPSEQQTWLLKSPGMGLGLNSGRIFDQSLKVETLQLKRQDKLFFYSDGITEAMNSKGDEYGEERLMAMAVRTDGLNAEQSRDAVMSNIAEFLAQAQPQDDQTLVVLQVL